MRLPRYLLYIVGLLGIVALVAVACGGDEEEEKTTTPATTAAASPTATEVKLKTDVGVSDTEIVLGQHTALSGPVAVYQPIPPAQKAYFDYINATEGGVCDRKIVFKFEDDGYTGALALEKAKLLAPQVVAFVGNLGTPAHTGAVDYINEQEIPDLYVSTGASKWGDTATWPWTMGYIPDYFSEGRVLATYVNENFPGKTAGILYQNDDFGKDGLNGFKEEFAGTVVAEQSYEANAPNADSQLINIRDANPDIVYLYSVPNITASAIRYARSNNWSPQFVTSYVNANTSIAAILGGGREPAQLAAGFEAAAGTISTTYLLTVPQDQDNPAVVKHGEIMSQYGGGSVNTLTIYGQSLAELVVETLKVACENNDMTRAGVMEAAESIEGFRTTLLVPGLEINLSASDHFAIQGLQVVEWNADGTLAAQGSPISVE
ncbi:MAG: ABC transporter substrate-binding protein [Chloroflexi bacterium]|nr:ABC transporter substrate-binding protein [Chloroflexota bacterium]